MSLTSSAKSMEGLGGTLLLRESFLYAFEVFSSTLLRIKEKGISDGTHEGSPTGEGLSYPYP